MERKSSKKGFGKRQKETETSQAKVPLFKKWNDKRKRERERTRKTKNFGAKSRGQLIDCFIPHGEISLLPSSYFKRGAPTDNLTEH